MSISTTPVHDALIVAGGRGTRLQPLTNAAPKPLLDFCGEPFLAGVIRRLAPAGIQRVFLVVGADTAPFERLRATTDELGLTLELVPEPEPLDTAGGVRSVADELRGTCLVLNGDILTDVDVTAAIAAHRDADAAATIVLTQVEDTSSFGVCVRDGSRITEFVEKPPPGTLPGQDAINAGTYVLEPEALLAFPEGRLSFEREVFPGILARGGRLEGMVWDGVWADLGTPQRFLAGHRMALSGELAWPSVNAVDESSPGVRIAAAAHVDPSAKLDRPVLVLDGATIAADATVGPYVVVGADAKVGAGARIEDSILFDGADLGDGVTASGLLAGPGAVVPAGVELGRDVVLGSGERLEPDRVVTDGERIPPATG